MSRRERLVSTGKEPCAVCNDDVEIHAIGPCGHSICYKCSTRMRVLCDQQYCAICRADLPKVAFVKEFRKFQDINTNKFQFFRKHKILFETEAIQNVFYDLISHKCKFCPGMKPLRTFHQLEQHMRREHGLHYCDICLIHLKVFSMERKCYDRERLARHRRLGDEDDKSFKGHPLCELCDQRFLDRDELARHCRKEHFRCHFCETDGNYLEFFGSYHLLRDHFRQSHFLCEEGDCIDVQFTNAFRSDIDLKAHKAQYHSRGMKKAEARQARTIELDIQLAPRSAAQRRGGRGRGNHERDRGGASRDNADSESRQQENWERKRNYARQQREEVEAAQAVAASLNHISRQSGAVAVVDPALLNQVTMEQAQQQDTRKFEKRTGDFPTLSGGRVDASDDSDSGSRKGRASDTLAKKLALANNFSVQDGSMEEGDFPTLGGKNVRVPTSSKQNIKPTSGASSKVWSVGRDETDFPSLSSPKSKRIDNKRLDNNTQQAWAKTASQPAPGPALNTQKPTARNQSARSGKVPGSGSSQSQTQRPSSAYTKKAEDYPSLSSIGNSLIPATSQPPAPKLSVFRSSQSAATVAASDPDPPPASAAQPSKQKSIKFDKKDFPSLGGGSSASKLKGQWVSKPKEEDVPPKTDKKQKKKQDKQEMKVLSSKAPVQNTEPPTKEDTSRKPDLDPPKAQKPVRAVVEEKQEKELENFVAKHTKNKKKKGKKGKKSPDSTESRSAEASDVDSDKEDKVVRSRENSLKDISRQVTSQIESEKQALQPKPDNFPSLSELSESIPTAMTMTPPPQFTKDDFPSLQSEVTNSKPPPGFKSQKAAPGPPPGFKANTTSNTSSKTPFLGTSQTAVSNKPPPPGFGGKTRKDNIENVAPSVTNGSTVEYSYIPSATSKDRNRQLIQDVQRLLSADQFSKFKTYSGEFRQAIINGTEYYNKCCDIMSSQAFEQIFPELLVLLPDIEKQQVLLSAHNDALSKAQDVIKISKSGKRGWKSTSSFTSCPTCRQVVTSSDLASHSAEHNLDMDFPSLGNIAASTGLLGGWGKK